MKIIKLPQFEIISLTVIVINSITMALDDKQTENDSTVFTQFEQFFLIFYTVEIVIKILGMGFILNKGSFMREGMNVLDFFIVFSAYLQIIFTSQNSKQSLNFSSLRVVR